MRYSHFFIIIYTCFLAACTGADYMPQYFPIEEKEPSAPETPLSNESDNASADSACTVQFESRLCVIIKGENIEVGTGGEEPLCADVDPIPIEVSGGQNLIMRGSAFPDIPFEGHGLPAPITINGKGSTDGSQNIGRGTLDESGNIIIENFSFFVNALGMVGEIPELMLTTEEIEGIDLPSIAGTPLDSNGDVLLVAGTILGHLFPAADEKLFGAELQATFEGNISPNPKECKGTGAPQSTFVTKLVADNSGNLTEALLPGGTEMEVGSGTYIAESPYDIGEKFEAKARFKILNATAKPLSINIPPVIGAFYIEARGDGWLKKELPPKTPLVIDVGFRPDSLKIKAPGKISEMLFIGGDVYHLIGHALQQGGKISIDILDKTGAVETAQADSISFGETSVFAVPRKEFFLCQKIKCGESERPTKCVPCVDVLANVCQLLQVGANGAPIEEVDADCKAKSSVSASAIGTFAIPSQKVISIKNAGTKPTKIESIEIRDIPGSKSLLQFKLGKWSPELPQNIVITYEPTDLIGFDGTVAVPGHPAKDKALLNIKTADSGFSAELIGFTSIKESPLLEVYFKTSTGLKALFDGSTFAFRGITPETSNMAVPVFIKLSDGAANSLKISKIELDNTENFEWLDSKEKASSCLDLNPVSLVPDGFILSPEYTIESMPLFGCVNFKMNGVKKRQYESLFKITATELGQSSETMKNPDGSIKQVYLNIKLLAVVNPLKGRIVWRLTQSMAVIMNPQFPGNSAVAAKEEIDHQIAEGLAKEEDRFVMPSPIILDPFDEETITDEFGNVITTPGDGVTAVYRKIDTHPVSTNYDSAMLPDYTSLIFDGGGTFFDYPNMPENYKAPALRIYTAGLSYPGPLANPENRPENVSLCQVVDPCSGDGQKMLGAGPTDKSKRGVCAFFYTSAGAWESPSFQEERTDLCKKVGEPQKLKDMPAYYTLDGRINVPNAGLRLFGPTYFHNPSGPLGPVQPLDAIFHTTFTTDVLLPKNEEAAVDVLPDKRINIGKLEYKINLTDTTLDLPRLCETTVKNRLIGGEYYSTWKYLAPYLVKDEEGTVSAGCPEPGNSFTGGSAYLRGKPVNMETGSATFVTASKFANDDDLTFAFKDVMFFTVLNGWFCDPEGNEADYEGEHCYDLTPNERDATNMVTIMKE